MTGAPRIAHNGYKHWSTSHFTSLIGMFLDVCVAKSHNERTSCDDADFHDDALLAMLLTMMMMVIMVCMVHGALQLHISG